jgi:hypothetical protein
MPNIRGSLIHVPKPKPRRGDKFRAAAGKAKQKVGEGTAGPRAKTRAAFGNVTSKPGTRKATGEPFGRLDSDQKLTRANNVLAFGTGGIIGGSIASASFGPTGHGNNAIRSNRAQIAANNRKLKNVEKALRPRNPRHLITDAKTASGRFDNKIHHPGYYGMAGMAAGGLLVAPPAYKARKKQKKTIAAQQRTLGEQRKQLSQGKVKKNMSVSAFGVDHGGEFSKADNKKPKTGPSVGRVATGTLFPGWHGAIAGKKGKKLEAAGSGLGHSIGGSLAGAALTRGNPAGAQFGGYAGAARSVYSNHNKGRLKKQ